MSWSDGVNAFFEAGGSIVLWQNVARLYKDKGYAGINWQAIAFFASWGAWNLFYYPNLGQWWSFIAGISVTSANTVFLLMMLKYGRKQ